MLYTLLVGRPPFDTNEVASTHNRVVAGHYVMPDHITMEAKDLLFRLLQKNPKDRIPIEDVLKHPFMIKYCGTKAPISYHTTDSGILTMSSAADSNRMPLQMLKRSRSEERFNPMPASKPNVPTNNILSENNLDHLEKRRGQGDSLFHGMMQQLDKFQINPKGQSSSPSHPYNYESTENVLSGIVSPKESLLHIGQPAVQPRIDVPPFTTIRLQPTRHQTKNAVLTICESGEIVLEFIKYKPRFREDRIVDVCRISSDGQRIVMFQPTVQGGAKLTENGPLEVPPTAAQEQFQYATLPKRH